MMLKTITNHHWHQLYWEKKLRGSRRRDEVDVT